MTTLYYYDIFGWLTSAPMGGRSTDVPPPTETASHKANWTGEAWVLREYTASPDLDLPAPNSEPRHITLGGLQKRIGPMTVFAIDTSTHPVCVALRNYLSRLDFVDLDDPDLPPMLGMMVAAGQPAANPVFPGSGPLTESKVAEIIGAPVQPKERP